MKARLSWPRIPGFVEKVVLFDAVSDAHGPFVSRELDVAVPYSLYTQKGDAPSRRIGTDLTQLLFICYKPRLVRTTEIRHHAQATKEPLPLSRPY